MSAWSLAVRPLILYGLLLVFSLVVIAVMGDIVAQLSDALGAQHVLPWKGADRFGQVTAAIASEQPPSAIALPPNTETLGKVMALATEHHWRVLPTGQGSKLSWGGLAEGIDVVVSTAQLNSIVEHAVGDFTVTVQPGVKVADLQHALAEHRQFLAIDPAFDTEATVGGVVATADTGSLRQRYGGLRDMLIGVQFVRYDGEVARAGGRVVKNVAGYDLMKLLTGAYGSLGILSELTFRLYPMQATSRSLVLSGPSAALEAAIAEVRLSGLTPVALDVLSSQLLADLTNPQAPANSQQPAHEQQTGTAHMGLVARFQGIADGVQEQTERLEKIATTHALSLSQLDDEADQAFWHRSARIIRPDTLLCKVGLRPSGIPWLIELADMVAPGSQVRLYGSSGLGWIQLCLPENAAEQGYKSLLESLEKLRSHCQKNAGFLTLLQAPKPIKQAMDVWGYSGNALSVMGDIKQKFDPHRLLSPGRFVGDL